MPNLVTRIDMVDLLLFTHIAETSSVRHGAERSHMSAPSASARIKHLEEVLEAPLLERTSRGVKLTPPGQAFLHHAKLVLLQLEDLGGDLAEYKQRIHGHIRIATNSIMMTEFLPRILRDYRTRYPGIVVDLRERSSADIVRGVTAGTFDVGLISNHVGTEKLEVQEIMTFSMVVVAPVGHPLADRPSVWFQDTLPYEQIVFTEQSPTHGFVHQRLAAAGIPFKFRVQATHLQALYRLVEMDLGIGIVPEPSARRHALTMGIRVIPLDDEEASSFKLLVCARRFSKLSAFARDFVDLLMASRRPGKNLPS